MRRTITNARLTASQLAALFSHDPAQAGILTTVALAGVAVIWLWGLYGDLLFSNLVVATSTSVLTFGYAGSLAVMAGRLVRSQDRWQVDSALTLRDLLSDRTNAGANPQAGSSFYVRQLRLRLDEEIRRCKGYGTELTVVAVRLELPGQAPSHAVLSQANAEMAELVAAHRDALTCPTSLGLFEYAFLLPGHDRQAAEAMTAWVARTLKRYRCSFGLAVFPEDATDADTLLRRATEHCGVLHSSAA